MEAQFKFTESYQELLLACLVERQAEFAHVMPLLKAAYFSGIQLTLVGRCILKYGETHGKPPSWPVVGELVRREVQRMPEADIAQANDTLDRLSTVETGDWEHVRGSVVTFVREAAYRNAIRESIEDLRDGKVPAGGFAQRFEAVAQLGTNLDDLGFLFHRDVDEVITKVSSVDYGIATGYPLLDRIWPRGWGPGWLVIPLAPPKRYKTGFSINVACNVVSPAVRGDVIYYACELSQELAMMRAMCNIGRISSDLLYEAPGQFAQHIKAAMAETVAAHLLFKSFSSKQATIADIRLHALTAIKQLGIRPRLIVIDYAETIKPADKTEKDYRQQSSIYTDARALGKEIGCAVLMPDRCNKETTNMPVPNMKSFQGAFEKAGIVDVAFGLCATETEHKDNVLRWFNFLNRHGKSFQHLRGKVDPESWRIEFNEEIEFVESEGSEDEDDGGKRGRKGRRGGDRLPPELTE